MIESNLYHSTLSLFSVLLENANTHGANKNQFLCAAHMSGHERVACMVYKSGAMKDMNELHAWYIKVGL